MKLTTERLTLRDLESKDAKEMVPLINTLDVSRHLLLVPYPYSSKDAKKFIKYCKKEAKKKPRETYELGIFLKESKKLIGVIGLTKVDKWTKAAVIGFWLGKKYHRKGYMIEACKKVIKFAFDKLKLQRIDTNAFVKNKASNNLIKKLGFTFEGTRKRYVRAKSTGKFHDVNMYGLLKRK